MVLKCHLKEPSFCLKISATGRADTRSNIQEGGGGRGCHQSPTMVIVINPLSIFVAHKILINFGQAFSFFEQQSFGEGAVPNALVGAGSAFRLRLQI